MRDISQEIKITRSKRLKKVLDDTGMQRKEFADKIKVKPSYLSVLAPKKLDGFDLKRLATVTPDIAGRVSRKFPSYSVEWLLGKVDYRNEEERSKAEEAHQKYEGDRLALGLGAISDVCGYKMTATVVHELKEVLPNGTKHYVPDTAIILSRDGKSVTVPRDELKALQQEVMHFVDFRLSQMLNRNN